MTEARTLLDHLAAHRSIRRYRPDPIPDDLLNELLETGLRASSSGNMQTWSVIVTRDAELREALVEPHMGQEMVREAPAVLTFCADVHRMRRWLALRDAPDANDDFMAFMVAAIDAVLASQNVALAAEAHGLGICYMGSTLANCDAIGRVLRLPWGVVPVVGFVLGHPAEDPPQRDRLPLEGLVHDERYRTPTDEEVLDTYRDREVAGWDRYMGNPRLRARVEEAGVRNLAQLYAILKYPKDDYAVFSSNVLGYLAEQGFLHDLEERAARAAGASSEPGTPT